MPKAFNRFLCLTCDVEIAVESDFQCLKQILQLLRELGVRGTFFVQFTKTNYSLLKNHDLISYFSKEHELGLHIHWGLDGPLYSGNFGLNSLSYAEQRKQLVESLKFCSEVGFKPKSFRGGGLCQTSKTLKLINKYGFLIDSSVAPKLNQTSEWLQSHTRVPYRSWYYPSKRDYAVPASNEIRYVRDSGMLF